MKILVYSESSETRRNVIESVGIQAAKGQPEITWIEAATPAGATIAFEENSPQVLVLDGESTKAGGMSVARQLADRYDKVGPIVMLTARPQDKWLATWAGSSVVLPAPYDPIDLQNAVAAAVDQAS